MHRAGVALLAAACLIAGCGEPAAKPPAAGAPAEAAAPDGAALDLAGDAAFSEGEDVFSEGEPSDREPAPAAAAGETGEALYRRLQCAGCHEVASRPGQPVIPLARLSERYSADTLAAFLAAPTPPMPSLDLDAEQRSRLAWYLLSAHP
jgi:hypothetical protein